MASDEEKLAQKKLDDAAAITKQTTEQVLAFLKDLYGQQREDQLPWLQTGASANQKLAYLMGLSGANHLRADPNFRFSQAESRRADPVDILGRGQTGLGRTSTIFDGRSGGGGGGDNDPGPPTIPRRRGPGEVSPVPDDFARGYASNPLALIAGAGRASPSSGMVQLRAPTGEVRPVPAAMVPHYLQQGARLA